MDHAGLAKTGDLESRSTKRICLEHVFLDGVLVQVIDFRYTIIKAVRNSSLRCGVRRYAYDIPCLVVAPRVIVCSKEVRITF